MQSANAEEVEAGEHARLSQEVLLPVTCVVSSYGRSPSEKGLWREHPRGSPLPEAARVPIQRQWGRWVKDSAGQGSAEPVGRAPSAREGRKHPEDGSGATYCYTSLKRRLPVVQLQGRIEVKSYKKRK